MHHNFSSVKLHYCLSFKITRQLGCGPPIPYSFVSGDYAIILHTCYFVHKHIFIWKDVYVISQSKCMSYICVTL